MKQIVVILLSFLMICCGSDDQAGPILSSIRITSPVGSRIAINESVQLEVSGLDQTGADFTLTDVSWSSDNSNVSIDQSGSVTAVAVGNAVITAEADGITDSFAVSVWDNTVPRTEYYVSDAGNGGNPPYQILVYDENGANPQVFIDNNLGWPQDILFLEDQEVVLISNLSSGNINRHNINSGQFIDSFATNIGGPTRIKIGPDGLLYVLQWTGDGLVQRYQLDGTFVDNFTSVGVVQSIGLDWDTEGNLYVSSYNSGSNGSVRKFDPEGNDLGLLISTGLQGPTDIWFDDQERLMINDWMGGVIRRYDLTNEVLSTIANGLSNPEGIAHLPGGGCLIGNGGTSSVRQYGANNNFIQDFISSGSGGLLTPNAVVIRVVN